MQGKVMRRWLYVMGMFTILTFLGMYTACGGGGGVGNTPGSESGVEGSTSKGENVVIGSEGEEQSTPQTETIDDTGTDSGSPDPGAPDTTPDTTPDATPDTTPDVTPEQPGTPDQSGTPDATKPDQPAGPCVKLGGAATAAQKCCAGLTKGTSSAPPQCTNNGRAVCVKCGDGKCDTASKETSCNCPADCKPSGRCRTAADCGKTTCTQTGTTCTQNTPACRSGSCANTSRRVANAKCDQKSGRCVPSTPGCKVRCDCNQGLECVSGKCIAGVAPVYCCDKAGCRAGAACKDKAGKDGKCGGSSGGCKANGDCGKPSCRTQLTNCVQTTPTCSSGKCSNVNKTVSNASCNSTTGLCVAAKRCRSSADCGSASCKQSGGTCVLSTPRCTLGRCTFTSQNQVGRTCRNNACVRVQCRSNSDCKPSCRQQGSTCTQVSASCRFGSCSAGRPQTFSGRTCNTTSGVCEAKKCSKASDCGKPTCRQFLRDCRQSTPRCSNGACGTPTTTTVRTATCDSSTGLCKKSTTCRRDSDCKGTTTCKQSGGNCVLSGPRCSTGVCSTGSRTYSNQTCANNKCSPTTCRSNSDCKGSSCRQLGSTCYLSAATCRSGTCRTGLPRPVRNKRCDTATGTCK